MPENESWFDYAGFYSTMAERGFGKLVEVGVHRGNSFFHLLKERGKLDRDFILYAVDPWERVNGTSGYERIIPLEVREDFEKRLASAQWRKNVVVMQMTSVEASRMFNDASVDFVFIDGNHAEDFVNSDIDAWLPKVKPGGVIAGHDYPFPDVMRAVKLHFGDFHQDGACWWKTVS